MDGSIGGSPSVTNEQQTGTHWVCYDDITCMCIELNYHKYLKTNHNKDHQFVAIHPNYKIDLKEWIQIDNDDKSIKRKIKRGKNLLR